MRESNLVVDRNIEAFARIVTAKCAGHDVDHDGFGQSFPRALEDMQGSLGVPGVSKGQQRPDSSLRRRPNGRASS
jgi:hypothetical protein